MGPTNYNKLSFVDISWQAVFLLRILGPSQNDKKWIDLTCSKSDCDEDHIAGSHWEVNVATFW